MPQETNGSVLGGTHGQPIVKNREFVVRMCKTCELIEIPFRVVARMCLGNYVSEEG